MSQGNNWNASMEMIRRIRDEEYPMQILLSGILEVTGRHLMIGIYDQSFGEAPIEFDRSRQGWYYNDTNLISRDDFMKANYWRSF